MKKTAQIIPLLAIFLMASFFTGCKKDTECKVKITCKYSTGIDMSEIAPGAYVEIGKPEFAEYAKRTGIAGPDGVFPATFELEALLNITAEYFLFDADSVLHNYIGATQEKLIAGETVEAEVIMYEIK